MADVLAFTPRQRRQAPPPAIGPADMRRQIEEVAQSALDTADHLLRLLDTMDGDPDLEPDADAEPSLAAPENHHASQVVWLRGDDRDLEQPQAQTQDHDR